MEVESSGAAVENASKNKTLFIVLGVFGVLIVGLVIAIAIVKSLPKKVEEIADDEPVGVGQISSAEIKEYTGYYEAISAELSKIYADDEQGMLDVYQRYINNTEDEKVKAMLEMDYYNIVMAYDTDKTKAEEVVAKAIEIDDVLKTIDSGVFVLNVASNYGNEDLVRQYDSILNERQGLDETNEDNETVGCLC
ncbi:hypothetical protein J6S55_02195 [Candidatus Saccharibacteria bacterium]|nr:hypothetical protein [Candidatus Saccharibacteria bacterium]